MPDHRVVTTFTLVKFLLSFAAFTEVLVSVYTRKMFTWVSKLSYLSKPFKSKHGISYFGKISSCMDDSGVTEKKKTMQESSKQNFVQWLWFISFDSPAVHIHH